MRLQCRLPAGDTFLIYPNTEIIYRADMEDPWEYAWVGFNGSDAATILQATDFTKEKPYIHASDYGEEIHRHVLQIYDARGNSLDHALEMTGRLYRTLALFIRHAHEKETQNTAASYVGLSRSHLFRSFELIMQQSPKEYLTAFRMKQACSLLEHTSLSITAIANSVGFDNGLYFSKTFHKKKGISPKAFRANAKNSRIS